MFWTCPWTFLIKNSVKKGFTVSFLDYYSIILYLEKFIINKNVIIRNMTVTVTYHYVTTKMVIILL